jgi:hypothetical protein
LMRTGSSAPTLLVARDPIRIGWSYKTVAPGHSGVTNDTQLPWRDKSGSCRSASITAQCTLEPSNPFRRCLRGKQRLRLFTSSPSTTTRRCGR